MKELVTQIGTQFEFHRANFNPDHVDSTSLALDQLYELFEVQPVAQRRIHDGVSMIQVSSATWQQQHKELWQLLIPSSGAAQTLQGEIIRISGRIGNELKGNGGINWDEDFKMMADQFLEFIKQGQQLSIEEIGEVQSIINEVKRKRDDKVNRLAELAVKWVVQNPTPIPTPPLPYDR